MSLNRLYVSTEKSSITCQKERGEEKMLKGEKRTSPTPKQINMCKLMVEHPELTQIQVAEKIGVTNVTVCNWLKLDFVQEELDRQLKEAWRDSRRQAQQKMFDLMNNASDSVALNAAKYILDANGYAPSQDINLNTGEIEVNITGKKED